MKCEQCGSNHTRAYIKVMMYIDSKDCGHLTKGVIAKSTTELWAVDWDKTSFICADCGHAWGYGYNN